MSAMWAPSGGPAICRKPKPDNRWATLSKNGSKLGEAETGRGRRFSERARATGLLLLILRSGKNRKFADWQNSDDGTPDNRRPAQGAPKPRVRRGDRKSVV